MATIGRPPKFTSVDELEFMIEQYFTLCESKPYLDEYGEPMMDKHGNVIVMPGKPPTITGLALHLGFNGRSAFKAYNAKKEFMPTITRAKARIEEYAEGRLYDKDGCRGAMFYLSLNADGWKESKESETDITLNLVSNILDEVKKKAENGGGI